MEIERKFLVKQVPISHHMCNKMKLLQGYISLDPALRLRSSGDKYIFTFKSGQGLSREEFESVLTKEQFDNLWVLVSGNNIEKDRYNIPLENDLIAELDIYHGRLAGFATVEVEFSSIDQANAFNPPDWFGEDVTDDIRYSNSSLSQELPPSFIPS